MACGYRLDFVLYRSDGRIAALEADGWEIHYPDGRLREEDIQRQRVLERAGWTVFRVHSRGFYRDPESALAHVLDYFAMDEMPEGRDEADVDMVEIMEVPDVERRAEIATEAPEMARAVERTDPARLPLQDVQEALRPVAPEPGVETKRDELFRRALPLVGRQRLTQPVRERFKAALRGLIQRGEFGYRGQEIVWQFKAGTGINIGEDVTPPDGTLHQAGTDDGQAVSFP